MTHAANISTELAWLKANPAFSERPASMEEFIGPDYLNIADGVRSRVLQELREIMGSQVSGIKPTVYPEAMITGGIGIGKQLKYDTLVLTPKGWREIGTLAVGDIVTGSNGFPTTVTGFFPQGINPLYRVTFTDGTWVDAGAEHQWAVRTRFQEYKNKPFRTMTTQQIKDHGLRQQDGWKWRIPIVEPVHYEGENELVTVDPYLLGCLLGDGCFTRRTVTLAGDDLEIGERIKWFLPFGISLTRHQDNRQWSFSGISGVTNQLVKYLERLGYRIGFGGTGSHDKFIPEQYMQASPTQRLEMLRGLMDTDGSVVGNNRSAFSNNNLHLCEQVMELVQSLGGTARLVTFDRRETTEYTVHINLGLVCPFWLQRKAVKWKPRTNQFPSRAITSIEYVGDDEAFCISVDAPDHLYVVKDFIVTHNTTIASIVLPYLAHWTLCLKDPQAFFDLLPGSRIAFMQMSTSEKQALEVVFGDIKARIKHSPWFQKHPFDPAFKNQLRFEKDIWIIPGDSSDLTFEGYNILGGIIDEADCADIETEILTDSGWKDCYDLDVGDQVLTLNHETGLSEWQDCLEVKIFPGQPREVVRMEGKEFSSLTTLNHRWSVIRPSSPQKRTWVTTKTLGFWDQIPRAAMSADLPTEPKYSDALIELVAWFWTEGHDRQDKGLTAWIHQSPRANPENCERIRAALRELFGSPVDSFPRQGTAHDYVPRWRENLRENRDDYWGSQIQFILSAGAGKIIQEHAPNKIPSHTFLRSLTKAQLELFIQISLLGDNNGPRRLAQKDRLAAEAFAFACILAGYAVSIRPHPPTSSCPSVMWNVYFAKKRFHTPRFAANAAIKCGGNGMTITNEVHNGLVWCPRTSNGTWLARRNGSVYFTGNSHKVTKVKDYAEDGYNAISNRISSRFQDRGFLLIIGQMKMSGGFAARKFEEFKAKPDAYAVRLAIWDSMGDNFYAKDAAGETIKFAYDVKRKQIIPDKLVGMMGVSEQVTMIPKIYEKQFKNNPEKALKDLAGMPPLVNDPFISLVGKIEAARDRWVARFPGLPSPVRPDGRLEPWFKAPDTIKRTVHVDIGVSADGDALGFAMAHVPEMVIINGERKPYIVVDLLLRMKALPGGEIFLGDVRQWIYNLRDQMKFKIEVVSLDGFESTDTMQQLQRRRFYPDYVSVDSQILPYHDLREALYEDRIDFPPYIVDLHTDTGTVQSEILVKELSELVDTGRKIDHPLHGSKDVADAVAGVTFTLMGDRRYHRNTASTSTSHANPSQGSQRSPEMGGVTHPAFRGDFGMTAPLPPTTRR